jgi:hypothetical protein
MELYGSVEIKTIDQLTTQGVSADLVIEDGLFDIKTTGILQRLVDVEPKLIYFDEMTYTPSKHDFDKWLASKIDCAVMPSYNEPHSTNRGYRSKGERKRNKRDRWS